MAYTDRELIKQQEAGQAATSGASDPIGEVAKVHSYWVAFSKSADDAMASTTTSETYTGVLVPVKSRLKSVKYVATTGGITANATTYATITVNKRDSAAANKLAVASFATDTVTTDDVTQGVPKEFDLTTANIIIAAGSTITYEIAKASTGVVVRAGTVTLELEAV